MYKGRRKKKLHLRAESRVDRAVWVEVPRAMKMFL
jgi:hypothetical protein